MLHSGHFGAKSFIDNRLTRYKAHLVGVGKHHISTILWPNPRNRVKQILNFHGLGTPLLTKLERPCREDSQY